MLNKLSIKQRIKDSTIDIDINIDIEILFCVDNSKKLNILMKLYRAGISPYYVDILKNKNESAMLSKLRISAHKHAIEGGRYLNIPKHERRTSDSLNEGLPIKMTREMFQRKRYFFYEKDSRFNPRLIHKSSFLIGQVPIEKYGLKTLCLLFNI